MVPFSEAEEYFTLIQCYCGRLILALVYSDTVAYLGEIYKSQ